MINFLKDKMVPFLWEQIVKQGFLFVVICTFSGIGIGYFWSENVKLRDDIRIERTDFMRKIEAKNEELKKYLLEDRELLREALNNNSRVMENMMAYLKGKENV